MLENCGDKPSICSEGGDKIVPSQTKMFTIALDQGDPLPKERAATVVTHRE